MKSIRTIVLAAGLAASLAGLNAAETNWFLNSFYLFHADHHTAGTKEVGRDADPAETARLINLSRPDVIQIHAKGNPGWTTYPSKIGHTPPKLARDVMQVWRDIASGNGYVFTAYYNLGRDGEIMKRRPEWNRVKANGQPVERALCYHSGVAENYLWPMIDEIMEKYHPSGFWFDGSCFTVANCYCAKCKERFQREHRLALPKKPADPGYEEFKEMQRNIYRECVRDTAARIKKRDPKCLVTVNWAYSLRMPEDPPPGVDYYTGDHGSNVDELAPDAIWYDSQPLPFELMTTTFVGGQQVKPAPQLEQEMGIIVAHGGRFNAWDHPSPESGLDAERMAMCGKVVAPFLRARQAWCLGSRRLPDVSLFHGAAAHYALSATSPMAFPRQNAQVLQASEKLRQQHLNHEMISDRRLAAGDIRSALLLVEHPARLTRENLQALNRHAQNGGRVLLTGQAALTDGAAELAGIRLEQPEGISGKWSASLASGPGPFSQTGYAVKTTTATLLKPMQNNSGLSTALLTKKACGKGAVHYCAVPLFTSATNQATPEAIAEWALQQALPSKDRRIMATSAPDTVDLVLREKGKAQVLHLVNVAHGKRTRTPSGSPVTNQLITDIPAAPECEVTLRMAAKPATVTLQPQNQPLPSWKWENGELHLKIPGFAIHQMAVMEP